MLENHVVLAGGDKPTAEIPVWMNACEIYVQPSSSESFGTVIGTKCGKGPRSP